MKPRDHKRRIGAHVSVAGGLLLAPERAEKIGANCMQIFSSPPQQWRSATYAPEEMEAFKEEIHTRDLLPVFVHGVYLINLASDNPVIAKRSCDALILDLQFAQRIGADGVIFHLGSHPLGWSHGKRDQLINAFDSILQNSPQESFLIVENSAGGGHKIGTTIEELSRIYRDIRNERVKFCIDTAHAFAAGYDLRREVDVRRFVDEVNAILGWQHVVAIHANDSKADVGTRKDRHENIGKGKIGKAGFRALLHHPMVMDKPFIIETPGFKDKGPDEENIKILRKLARESTKAMRV